MRKLIVLLVILALNAGIALSQSTNRAAKGKTKIKLATARIHIDGFPKSKSGAI